MKKNLLTFALVLFSGLLSAQINDSFVFSISDFSFKPEGQYIRIKHSENTYTEDVGYPELPRIEVRYVIPYDSYVSAFSVTDSTVQMLQGTYLINPKQPDVIIGEHLPPFELDSAAYRSNQPYKGRFAELTDQYYEMGYHSAVVNIYPFSYVPQQNRLYFCSSINFSLQFSQNSDSPARPKMVSRPMLEQAKTLIKTQVKNASEVETLSMGGIRIVEMNEQIPDLIPLMQTPTGVLPQYVIITNNRDVNGNTIEPYQNKSMTDYFQELADWKTKKGVPAVVVTVDDICENYSGNDIQAKIHNFLKNVSEQYGMINVLLGGDVNVVPERMIDTNAYYNYIVPPFPSDYYYNAVDSTWDSNGNGIYGETYPGPVDYINYNRKFILGRIPVKDCLDASVFLNKDTTYEKMSGVTNRDYVNNVAYMVAAFIDNSDWYNSETHFSIDKHIGYIEKNYINSQFHDSAVYGISQDNIVNWRLFEDTYTYDNYISYATSGNYSTYHSIGWENHSMVLGRDSVLAVLNAGVHITPSH